MSPLLEAVLHQAEQLAPEERLELVQRIVEGLRKSGVKSEATTASAGSSKPKWSDLKGLAPYPMMGEDAQEWISRTRQEGDERRERLLRGEDAD